MVSQLDFVDQRSDYRPRSDLSDIRPAATRSIVRGVLQGRSQHRTASQDGQWYLSAREALVDHFRGVTNMVNKKATPCGSSFVLDVRDPSQVCQVASHREASAILTRSLGVCNFVYVINLHRCPKDFIDKIL